MQFVKEVFCGTGDPKGAGEMGEKCARNKWKTGKWRQ